LAHAVTSVAEAANVAKTKIFVSRICAPFPVDSLGPANQ
jgi:hypothetical protein